MSDKLTVLLEDAVAGTLTRTSGRLRFDYEPTYLSRTPLSVSIPVQVESHGDPTLAAWLWGLLPDNDAVLRRWGREFQVSASSPFSMLGTAIGEDCAGAVRFVAPGDEQRVLDRDGDVHWLEESDVEQRLRDLRQDSTAWLGRSFTGQFSLAGAQAKTALLREGDRWGLPSGARATTHILKPAIGGLDDHDLNEHLCLDAARRAGLVVARSRIARFGEETAVVVERYDRRADANGRVRRIHQEDFCQALGLPPDRKYQNEGGPTPGRIARLLRDVMPPDIGEDAVWRFADALIWNWLIGGTDAHAKNYSLLLAGDQARLAPLYDVSSALPYGVHERKLRLAMKFGGSYDVYLQRDRLPDLANELRIDAERLADRAREIGVGIADAFGDAAQTPDVIALGSDLPSRLVDLVAERSRRCMALIDGAAG